jgi:ribosomal protein L11 methyltransferase
MVYREIRVYIKKDFVDEFTQYLDEIHTEGYFEILFDSEKPRANPNEIISDYTNIHIYLSENDLEKELKILIHLKSFYIEPFFAESRVVETKEFEDAYKEFYKPFLIGDTFCVIPTWEKENPEAKQLLSQKVLPLYMNPGMAFGTGHHETTKLMLQRIPSLVKEGYRIADIGCGSGILSIAVSYLKAKTVYSLDIDPNAIKATEYNYRENTYPSEVEFHLLEGGFDHPQLSVHFDLILANITFAVISKNIKHIKKLSTNHFLFSGIITEKKEDAFELFQKELTGTCLYNQEFNGWEIIEWKR